MKSNKVLAVLAFAFLIAGCGNDVNDESATELKVVNITNSGCKSFSQDSKAKKSPSVYDEESIIYSISGASRLSVTHVNARHNCNPDKLDLKVVKKGSLIHISENENGGSANCICCYDLSCEIEFSEMRDYEVVYMQDGIEKTRFNINRNADKQVEVKL